ncbi:YraN family protein [Desulfovibrio mangrovi]|uniref:YraN family protein n=1 Tax=Desulfovibrio mangrovi TaxID=2976983 RepID=UPI002246CB9D|nr:YraN family protein [Desulfovibrio mangrovi]UZP67218.1 YraN family protein [Desulfovibrio mangrovi]
MVGNRGEQTATAPHLVTGANGEDAAARFLLDRGYRITARNWRHGRLELDIVCTRGKETIFVEVKTRSKGSLQRPDEALTAAKRRTLIKAAQHYISAANLWDRPCRFDLIAVVRTGDAYQVEHMENAFDLSEPVGGGNTAWQPW